MKASKILNEVIEEIKNKKFIQAEVDKYNLIDFKSLKYQLFRKFTTQRIRDFLYELYLLISSIRRNSRNNYVYIKNDWMRFFLDYFIYIFHKNPKIPFAFFNKKDEYQIVNFLKTYLLLNFIRDDNIFEFKFIKENIKEYQKKSKITKQKIKFKKGIFIYDNFSFVKPTDFYYFDFSKEFFKKKFKNIFDLGAYHGESSFSFYRYCQAIKIYAFEPDPDNFKILKENIKLNNLEKAVMPVDQGVGKKDGYFYIQKAGPGSEIKEKKDKNSIKVKVTTIDNFVKKNKIEKVDFIKMDIEGAEFDALKGAVKTLKRDKPDLMVAVYHKGEHFFEIPGWLKKQVPEYNLRFVAMNGASPIIERYVAASVERI